MPPCLATFCLSLFAGLKKEKAKRCLFLLQERIMVYKLQEGIGPGLALPKGKTEVLVGLYFKKQKARSRQAF